MTLPRRRHEPQRPGAGRRHPRRRAPPLRAASRSRTTARARACGPGTVLGHANRVLAPHGRKLGPDPASTDIATVGGVIANNSGGMRCGVVHDSYSTVRSLTFVLPSGTVIDTAAPGRRGALRRGRARARRAGCWRSATRSAPTPSSPSASGASSRSRTRPATGCARSSTPTRRWRSSGGCSSARRARSRSSPRRCSRPSRCRRDDDASRGSTSPSIDAAADAGPGAGRGRRDRGRADGRPGADRRRAQHPGTPEDWKELAAGVGGAAGRVRRRRRGRARRARGARSRAARRRASCSAPPDFTRDPETIEVYWRVREGMHGLVGKLRPPGTSLIIEDVCVPPARIAECAGDIQALLGEHGFLPGVAGHASAGNLHFMLTPDFAKAEDRERYEAFMGELVELIVDKYDGSLKAEHGTGLNMAPFVEREWGAKATEMMWRIKGLADPDGVLAPGVVLNRDPGVHLRNLKSTPPIEEEADDLRRVRLLRAGLPEPRPDDDAAPADRAAPRDGAPAARARRCCGRCSRSTSTTRSRPAPPTAPACSPARSGSTPASWSRSFRARQHAPSAPSGSALRRARRWAAVERAARGGLRRGAARRRRRGAMRGAHARGAQRRSATSSCRRGPPAMPRAGAGRGCRRPRARAPPPSTCRPASTGSSGPRARRGRPSLPEALVAVSRARRPAGVDPRRRRRPLLRDAVELEGLSRRARVDGEPRRSTRCGAGPTRASCRS